MSDEIKICISVRLDFERHYWAHPGLVAFLLSMMEERRYPLEIELVYKTGSYAGSANLGAYKFMDEHKDCEWYLQLDNDTVPPLDLLRIIDDLPDHVEIVSPIVCMIQGFDPVPMQGYYEETEDGTRFFPVLIEEPAGLTKVDRVGGGCWFIRRRVFEAMERPYFKVEFDDITQALTMTDDVYFQHQATKLGIDMYTDTRFQCAHYHTTELSLR